MVDKSPKDRVVGPLPHGRTLWLVNTGDPNYLLTGPKQLTVQVLHAVLVSWHSHFCVLVARDPFMGI